MLRIVMKNEEMMSEVKLSIVVLSWNTHDISRACLLALQADTSANEREVILVDNASKDGSADMVAREFPWVKLIRNGENLLYSEGNNQGARLATGRYLCILNSDTEVRPGALDLLVDFLDRHSDYGAAAPRLVNPDGSVQRACNRQPGLLAPLIESTSLGRIPPLSWISGWQKMRDFDHLHSRDVPQPPGACMVIRREEFFALGGLDPVLSLYFNDVDLCRNLLSRGRRIRYISDAVVMHHGGFSTRVLKHSHGDLLWMRNQADFYRKHYGSLGKYWLVAVRWLWGVEYRMRILLGPRNWTAKREAWAELRSFLQRCA